MTKQNKTLSDTIIYYAVEEHKIEHIKSPLKNSIKTVLDVNIFQEVSAYTVPQPLYDFAWYYVIWNWIDEMEYDEYFLDSALDDSIELDYYFDKFEKQSHPKKR